MISGTLGIGVSLGSLGMGASGGAEGSIISGLGTTGWVSMRALFPLGYPRCALPQRPRRRLAGADVPAGGGNST